MYYIISEVNSAVNSKFQAIKKFTAFPPFEWMSFVGRGKLKPI